MISFRDFDRYLKDFKKEQEEKGILSPFRRQVDADRIPEWLMAEEKYCVERIYADFGYADAMEYAFGQYRKSGLKEFFEDLRPCDYGDNCNMFCKNFIECKGEKIQ